MRPAGRHLTVLEQKWRTSDECKTDAAGWAVPDAGDEDDTFGPCAVAWTVTRAAETLPRPKRLPVRDDELPIATPDPLWR